jgi:hypothetical protein
MQQNDNSSVDHGFNYYGRTTCPDQRGGGTNGLVDCFKGAIGFSLDETVAIMGSGNSGGLIMLNVDTGLVSNFDWNIDPVTGVVSCAGCK